MELPSVPDDAPPLAVDIDGTLTDAQRAIDPRVIPVLREWPSPLVVATGKAMPYPVALCEFLALEPRVIAENGGVALAGRDGPIRIVGDREAANAVARDYREAGHSLGWGQADLVNRWRETEIAVSLDAPLAPLREVARSHGLEVVDTGFAYHVKSPNVDKGEGLAALAAELDIGTADFVAIGDSENDTPLFERVDRSVAVANADGSARAAADHVTEAEYADGFLAAVEWLCAD
ncbi:phosphoglycolate phosphatase [Halobacteriales archaeon Cl-PHB]